MHEYESPAKINWFLEVLGKRPDGYHELITVMQTIDWCDRLRFRMRHDGRIILTANDPELPVDERNLVVRAALLLQRETGCRLGADIELEKHIPIGAGLGGGSSNAATTLRALNDLWSLSLPASRLRELASKIGSDVAFFLYGGLAFCEGRGELVTPISSAQHIPLVVLWPGIFVSTENVYQIDTLDLTTPRRPCNFRHELTAGVTPVTGTLAANVFNRLEAACCSAYPGAQAALSKVRELAGPFPAALSGSGSSMFVVCPEREQTRIIRRIEQAFPPPARIRAVRTRGAEA